MRRRDVIKAGAGLATGAALPAVALGSDDESPLSDEEMGSEIVRLKKVLRTIDERSFEAAEPLKAGGPPSETGRIHEQFTRSAMKALVISELNSAVPAKNREHPELVEIRTQNAAEVGYAMAGGFAYLEATRHPDQRAELERMLEEDPDLVMRVGEIFDGLAGESKVGGRARLRLRRMLSHVSWKFRRQGVGSVIDESLSTTQRWIDASLSRVGDVEPPTGAERWDDEFVALTDDLRQDDEEVDEDLDIGRSSSGSKIHPLTGKTKSEIMARRAGKVGIASATLFVIGGLLVGGGVASGVPGLVIAGLFPLTAAVVCLIVAIVMSAIASSRKKLEAEAEGRLLPGDDL